MPVGILKKVDAQVLNELIFVFYHFSLLG